MALIRFSVFYVIALILNLCPACSNVLQYDETSPLWFCFRLLPPLCRLLTFRAYRRTMAFPNHVEVSHRLVSPSPYALGANMDASLVYSLRFSRGMTAFFIVEHSLPLGALPFCCGDFLAS